MFSHIHFQSLPVVDIDRALAFYRDVMGFAVERDNPYGESRWIFLKLPDGGTLLHFDPRATLEQTDKPVLVLASENVDAACETLRRHGAEIVSEPADAPWEPGMRWALIHDSEGNLVLIETIQAG